MFDYTSYPGVDQAAAVYGVTPQQLRARQAELNPIHSVATIAKANIPVYLIHGRDDQLVPLEKNSGSSQPPTGPTAGHPTSLSSRSTDKATAWPGYFRSEKLTDFLIGAAKGE